MDDGARDKVVIYTDGGCVPNPGVGGWGAVLLYRGRRRELSGGEASSTNNRMELTAAITALETLKRKCSVVLYTDSEYLRRGITEWLPTWRRRNWRRKGGVIVNLDLWQQLDAVAARHVIDWRWVPGHTGDCENERCDALAAAEIARRQR